MQTVCQIPAECQPSMQASVQRTKTDTGGDTAVETLDAVLAVDVRQSVEHRLLGRARGVKRLDGRLHFDTDN